MSWCKLAVAVAASGLCLAFPARGEAGNVGLSGMRWVKTAEAVVPVVHRRRVQSFYCYPKTYWWFYRPYTTSPNGHARCMPYFHYPVQPQAYRGRGGAYDAPVK